MPQQPPNPAQFLPCVNQKLDETDLHKVTNTIYYPLQDCDPGPKSLPLIFNNPAIPLHQVNYSSDLTSTLNPKGERCWFYSTYSKPHFKWNGPFFFGPGPKGNSYYPPNGLTAEDIHAFLTPTYVGQPGCELKIVAHNIDLPDAAVPSSPAPLSKPEALAQKDGFRDTPCISKTTKVSAPIPAVRVIYSDLSAGCWTDYLALPNAFVVSGSLRYYKDIENPTNAKGETCWYAYKFSEPLDSHSYGPYLQGDKANESNFNRQLTTPELQALLHPQFQGRPGCRLKIWVNNPNLSNVAYDVKNGTLSAKITPSSPPDQLLLRQGWPVYGFFLTLIFITAFVLLRRRFSSQKLRQHILIIPRQGHLIYETRRPEKEIPWLEGTIKEMFAVNPEVKLDKVAYNLKIKILELQLNPVKPTPTPTVQEQVVFQPLKLFDDTPVGRRMHPPHPKAPSADIDFHVKIRPPEEKDSDDGK
jgi:hypothetical protein